MKNIYEPKNTKITVWKHLETEKSLKCNNCNKIYNNRTGLWKHKKNV